MGARGKRFEQDSCRRQGEGKSSNGGLIWKPVFDDEPVASLVANDGFAGHPDIVWVGSGGLVQFSREERVAGAKVAAPS